MRQKVTSKKVTWKASGHPLYHVHLWMHLYQVWRKHRPLPACFTHSQEGQLQRNAPKTASPVFQRFISCHLVVLFFSYNPPLSPPVHLDASLVCLWELSSEKPQQNITATKENFFFSLRSGSWYNSGQGRSYWKSFPTLLKAETSIPLLHEDRQASATG